MINSFDHLPIYSRIRLLYIFNFFYIYNKYSYRIIKAIEDNSGSRFKLNAEEKIGIKLTKGVLESISLILKKFFSIFFTQILAETKRFFSKLDIQKPPSKLLPNYSKSTKKQTKNYKSLSFATSSTKRLQPSQSQENIQHQLGESTTELEPPLLILPQVNAIDLNDSISQLSQSFSLSQKDLDEKQSQLIPGMSFQQVHEFNEKLSEDFIANVPGAEEYLQAIDMAEEKMENEIKNSSQKQMKANYDKFLQMKFTPEKLVLTSKKRTARKHKKKKNIKQEISIQIDLKIKQETEINEVIDTSSLRSLQTEQQEKAKPQTAYNKLIKDSISRQLEKLIQDSSLIQEINNKMCKKAQNTNNKTAMSFYSNDQEIQLPLDEPDEFHLYESFYQNFQTEQKNSNFLPQPANSNSVTSKSFQSQIRFSHSQPQEKQIQNPFTFPDVLSQIVEVTAEQYQLSKFPISNTNNNNNVLDGGEIKEEISSSSNNSKQIVFPNKQQELLYETICELQKGSQTHRNKSKTKQEISFNKIIKDAEHKVKAASLYSLMFIASSTNIILEQPKAQQFGDIFIK